MERGYVCNRKAKHCSGKQSWLAEQNDVAGQVIQDGCASLSRGKRHLPLRCVGRRFCSPRSRDSGIGGILSYIASVTNSEF